MSSNAKNKSEPGKYWCVEVTPPIVYGNEPYEGSSGRNADHRLNIAMVADMKSNFRNVTNIPLGAACDTLFLGHEERSDKNGSAVILAEVKGPRLDKFVTSVSALGFDIDGKLFLSKGVELLQSLGIEAILYTSHSHLRTSQEVNLNVFRNWHRKKYGCDGELTDDKVREFCAEKEKKYGHLTDVRLGKDGKTHKRRERGKKVEFFTIEHDPEHKFRIIFPLKTKLVVGEDGLTVADIKAIYKAIGNALLGEGGYGSESANLSRLHFLPSHRPGAEFHAEHFEGDLLDAKEYVLAQLKARIEAETRQKKHRGSAQFRNSRASGGGSIGLGKLRKILFDHIHPDLPRDEWIVAIAATFHETRGSDEGCALVHEWSAGDGRYDFDETQAVWDWLDLDCEKPCTMGTLNYLAKACDPNFKVEPLSKVSKDEFEDHHRNEIMGKLKKKDLVR